MILDLNSDWGASGSNGLPDLGSYAYIDSGANEYSIFKNLGC